MSKEKTISDYKKLVLETKTKYLNTKMDFKLNYTFKEESHEGYESFYICNPLEAVRIIYSHEMKFIVSKTISMDDVKVLMEMRDSLDEQNQ
jgi:hypothetical protein